MTASPETTTLEVPEVPRAGDILQSVAEKLGLTPEQVERSLAEANITLKSPAAADRRLRMLRLRVQGVKHSGDPFSEPSPTSFSQVTGTGVSR